jgi:glycosyltransferase involved in cell wall biosynthesis
MGRRKQLALFFSYNENWIGGTYYILNLVHALNALPENKKPCITVVGHQYSDFKYIKDETAYPYLLFTKDKSGKSLWQKAINAFSLRILKKKLLVNKLDNKFDLLFPVFGGSDYLSLIEDEKKVDWIPDFQDFYLPNFYTPKALVEVKQRNIAKAYLSTRIVLSSEDAKKDFLLQFPDSHAEIYVIPFSVTHPDFSNLSFQNVKEKFHINRPYFYAPNQYWVHKNHQLIIKAIALLKEKNPNFLVLFSGKEWDPRKPNYTSELKQLVKDLKVEENIKFLGFLDRAEQLLIMQQAEAVIQPSLFEGWSTVVEDAKALNKFVFASNLAVHKEQLVDNVEFFNPLDTEELANKILSYKRLDRDIDYEKCRVQYAEKFMSLVEK